jgi:hypothetical protein
MGLNLKILRLRLNSITVAILLFSSVLNLQVRGDDEEKTAEPTPTSVPSAHNLAPESTGTGTGTGRPRCDRIFASIARFPLAAGLIGVSLAALGIQDWKKQKEIEALRSELDIKDLVLRIAASPNTYSQRSAFEQIYAGSNGNGWAPTGATRLVNEFVARLSKKSASEKEAAITMFLKEGEKVNSASNLVALLPTLLPLLDEEAQYRLLASRATNPDSSEEWIKSIGNWLEEHKEKRMDLVRKTTNALARDIWGKKGRDRVFALSRCLYLATSSDAAAEAFPPSEIERLVAEREKSVDPEERAAILALLDRLPAAEGIFHKLMGEEIARSENDSLRQHEFTMRLIQGRLTREDSVSSPEVQTVLKGIKDSSATVRAASAAMLPKLAGKEAMPTLMDSILEMDPGQYTQQNSTFVTMLATLTDFINRFPNGVDYEKLRKLSSRFPDNLEYNSFSLYSQSFNQGGMTFNNRYLIKEFNQAVRLNPILNKMENGNDNERLESLNLVKEQAIAHNQMIMSEDQESRIRLLLQKSPSVRAKFMEMAREITKSELFKNLTMGVAEDELKKNPTSKDRVVAKALEGVSSQNFDASNPNPRAGELGRAALKDADKGARGPAAILLSKLGDASSMPTILGLIAGIEKSRFTPQDAELVDLIISLNTLSGLHPDQLDKSLLKTILESNPPKEWEKMNRSYEFNQAYKDLRERAGLPPLSP